MRYFLTSLLLLGLGACHHDPTETPEPENPDWYVLKAPEAREIVAVTGDIDNTLLITTRYKIYRTTDRGKTWQTSSYKRDNGAQLGIFGFATHRDTLLALTAGLGMMPDSSVVYASGLTHYSADQGRTWPEYVYKSSTVGLHDTRVPLNRVRTPSGNTYRVATAWTRTAPGSNSYYVSTTGVEGKGGPVPKLPHEHQIYSISLDQQARLYVAASAPLKGQNQNFAYLDENQRNGVLYVSKAPLR